MIRKMVMVFSVLVLWEGAAAAQDSLLLRIEQLRSEHDGMVQYVDKKSNRVYTTGVIEGFPFWVYLTYARFDSLTNRIIIVGYTTLSNQPQDSVAAGLSGIEIFAASQRKK